VLVLASRPAPILIADAPVASQVVTTLEDHARSRRLARLATPGALVYSSVFPLVQLGLIVEYPGRAEDARGAVLATAAYLPLHLRHVRWATEGRLPPHGMWTLAALTAIVVAALPSAGVNWLPVFAVVALSAVLVLPWPWSLLTAGVVVVAQVPLAHAASSPLPDANTYYAFSVWWRASALFVPVWLLGAVRQRERARQALADDAVVRERLRIDGELRATVGAALDSIAGRGQRAAADLDAGELRALVDESRRALAGARQLITRYQRPTLAAELEAAAALLTAAGIPTRLDLPPGLLLPDDDAELRTDLRSATTEILTAGNTTSCTLGLQEVDGRVALVVHPHEEATT